MSACAYCGGPAGADVIHRDGEGIGPEVPLCAECFAGAHEVIRAQLTTFEKFPNEATWLVASRYGAELNVFATELVDASRDSGARWLVALCSAWVRSTIWSTAHPQVSFADLADRARNDPELQKVVSAAYRAGAGPFQILDITHDWSPE